MSRNRREPDIGLVYILINPSFSGMVKIGLTRDRATRRAAQLSKHAGVPTKFEVAYEELVGNCEAVERRLHDRFAAYRVSGRREFFRIPLRDAIRALQEEAARHRVDLRPRARIDLLPRLERRFRRWLHPELVGAFLVQFPGVVLLEAAFQPVLGRRDLRIEHVDLEIIAKDYKQPWFLPTDDPRTNALKLIELGSYTIVNTLPLFSEEAARYVVRVYEDTKVELYRPELDVEPAETI